MNEEQKFFKLLKYSNELKKTKESLRKKDFEAFKVLLNFSMIIENNIHYSEKHEYIELAKNFMAIYQGTSIQLGQMERNESLELANKT